MTESAEETSDNINVASTDEPSDNTLSHPVLELIRARVVASSNPLQRTDPYKLGLAIEGGGMRGVVSCGMASALSYLGVRNTFDAVYGASAGALNGTFFVTGKMPLGPSVFYEDINNTSFISWRRLFTRQPVMNLNFLLEHVLVHVKPLNWEGLLAGPIPLKVVVASLKTGASRLLSNFGSRSELFTALRGSATIPYLAGPPVSFEGDLLFDASLFEPLPYLSAIQDGCTHVLVLATRPRGRLRKPPSGLERFLVEDRLRRLSDRAAEAYLQRAVHYRQAMHRIETATSHPGEAPYIFGIQPSKADSEVSQLERRRDALIRGAVSGIDAVMRIMVPSERIKCFEVLMPVNSHGIVPKFQLEK